MYIVDQILLCLGMRVPHLTNMLRKFFNKYFIFEISTVICHCFF